MARNYSITYESKSLNKILTRMRNSTLLCRRGFLGIASEMLEMM